MTHLIRLLIASILPAVAATALAATGALTHAEASPPPTPEEAALIEWAYARFAAAGLELPTDLQIRFHRTKAPCGGNEGLHRPGRIDICRFVDENPEAEQYLREHALLHELAHEWTHRSLSAERQAAFLELRGTEAWNDPTHDWNDRGTEHAAEIMVWALLDRDAGFLNLYDATCASMTAGYRLLTGTDPLSPEFPCAT